MPNEQTIDLVKASLPYIASIILAITGVLTVRFQRRNALKQQEIDNGKFIVDAAKTLLQPYIDQVKTLEVKTRENEQEIQRLLAVLAEKDHIIIQRDNTIRILQGEVKVLQDKVEALENNTKPPPIVKPPPLRRPRK